MNSNNPFKGQQIHWTYKIKRKGQTSHKFLVTFCTRVCELWREPCALLFPHQHTNLCQIILLQNKAPIHNIINHKAAVIKGRMLSKRSLARPRGRMQDTLYIIRDRIFHLPTPKDETPWEQVCLKGAMMPRGTQTNYNYAQQKSFDYHYYYGLIRCNLLKDITFSQDECTSDTFFTGIRKQTTPLLC